jgi:hypothetical protein
MTQIDEIGKAAYRVKSPMSFSSTRVMVTSPTL